MEVVVTSPYLRALSDLAIDALADTVIHLITCIVVAFGEELRQGSRQSKVTYLLCFEVTCWYFSPTAAAKIMTFGNWTNGDVFSNNPSDCSIGSVVRSWHQPLTVYSLWGTFSCERRSCTLSTRRLKKRFRDG